MSEEKKKKKDNVKYKMLTFNLNDPVEKAMYDYFSEMKEKKLSVNRMLKNLILLHMANTGKAPEGYQMVNQQNHVTPALQKKQKKSSRAQFNLE